VSAEAVHTAFDEPQRRIGCEFMDWEGWLWPNHFGDPVGEHRAVRERVGVWDESPLRKWDFRGRDALRAADRIFTNDMLGLQRGQVRYAPFCDAEGAMVGDGTVFRFADDHAWVITALDSDLEHFEDVVGDLDVAIEPITPELPHVQLQGPGARDLLAGVADADLSGLGYFASSPSRSGSAAYRRGYREPGTPASSATRSSARPATRRSSGTPSPARVRSRTGWPPSRR
jgi:glycine cleavage system aminomethyltransferase T